MNKQLTVRLADDLVELIDRCADDGKGAQPGCDCRGCRRSGTPTSDRQA
jgi:hypothetical protein